MSVKVAGIWCKTKSDFDKHVRQEEYDHIVSYHDIYTRLLKSDPENNEPSDLIISLQIQKIFKNIFDRMEEKESLSIAFMFKHLEQDTVENFKLFIGKMFEDYKIDLVIIDRCDYPKRGVLSQFDSVKFIDND